MTKRRTFLAFLLPAVIGLSLSLFAGAQSYWPPAIGDYSGTNDYLSRQSDLTGNADGKEFTFSAWLRIDGGDGTPRVILDNDGDRLQIAQLGSNVIRFFAQSDVPGTVLSIATSPIASSDSWLHVITSIDLTNAARRFVYINGVADLETVTTFTNTNIDFTRTSWGLAASAAGASFFNGAISDLYFGLEYIELSVEANRRLFRDRGGFPVDLGVTGQIPTGTPAIIYMKTRANNAGINSGTGGDFAIQGAPLYSDGPFPFFPLTVPIPDRGMGSRIH